MISLSKKSAFFSVLWISLLTAGLFAFSLPQLRAQSVALPTTPPDAESGLKTFGSRCANCHGATGQGDGELAANLPNPPRVFADPAFRLTAVPSDLFDTISQGRVQKGMPPFGDETSNPIREDERWNLIAALYSFSTPPESLTQGQAVYEATCASCHGPDGRGVGPLTPPDLTRLDYWFVHSNQQVMSQTVASATHNFSLSDADLTAVVDYARTFSYAYIDPLAPPEPIATARISGTAVNASSNALLTSGNVFLRAFTTDLEPTLILTGTVGSDGRYQFDLTDIPPDLVYMITINYNGVTFNSTPGQITRQQTALDLPVSVYEQTSDPQGIQISQLHVLLTFSAGLVQVNELYIVDNTGTAVFMGEAGQPASGTFLLNLPAGAQNVSFQRGFNSVDSYIPAKEVIQTATGWADTLPVKPGRATLNLVVTYDLPYEDGLTLAHPLPYPTAKTDVIFPAVGVSLAGSDWTSAGTQQLSGGTYAGYTGVPSGGRLNFTLNGRPELVTDTEGNTLLVRNQTSELVIGGLALILSLVVVAGMMWLGQTTPQPASIADSAQINALLQEIADLDTAHENGAVDKAAYGRRRADLKNQLIALWPRQKEDSHV